MALPASITRMSFCGASLCAPITAAMRSAPSVCGVLYKIFTGSCMLVLNCMYGQGSASNCSTIVAGISMTDETIAFSISYFPRHSSRHSMRLLLPLWNSFIAPCSKSADLQLLLPMSIMRFNFVCR